ncbi:hypothetical protein [uncultured Dubosiella sp.]|uniref:hypothetical protein n=1 Tax=uncultured Dubosiella sp. TaxID=1937011 RepID=UPI00273144D8|nr:hypothetical protein [uncultured Dubosiella sp.]
MCEIMKQFERKSENKGRRQGRAEGRAEGRMEERETIMRNLYAKGMDCPTIAEVTGQTSAQVEAFFKAR